MATPRPGFQCILKVGAGNAEVGRAKAVKLNGTSGSIDITTRSDAGWKAFIQGLKEWDVTIEQLWVSDNAALGAIRTAYINGTTIAVDLKDGEAKGFTGTAIVTAFGLDQPLDGACMTPISLKGTGALTPV
jgi:predicted secreted protein